MMMMMLLKEAARVFIVANKYIFTMRLVPGEYGGDFG